MTEGLLSPTEVAVILNVKAETVRRMADRGELPYHAVGRLKRFKREDIEEYLEQCRIVKDSDG